MLYLVVIRSWSHSNKTNIKLSLKNTGDSKYSSAFSAFHPNINLRFLVGKRKMVWNCYTARRHQKIERLRRLIASFQLFHVQIPEAGSGKRAEINSGKESENRTHFPMYSPCSMAEHAAHRKHHTCHCLSMAMRAWPSFSSSEHPAHPVTTRTEHVTSWNIFTKIDDTLIKKKQTFLLPLNLLPLGCPIDYI